MNLYRTKDQPSFLAELTLYIIKNFATDFDKLKVLLPGGLVCSYLQQALLDKLGATILPVVISLNELTFESEEIFKIPSPHISAVNRLEEKIMLAEIISSYSSLNYDFIHGLSMAPALANLFFDFEANEIDIAQLENIPTLNQAQHWQSIYNFLNFAYRKWQNNLAKSQKLSQGAYQKLMFQSELNRLANNPDRSLLIAGILGNNLITRKFIKEAAELKNAHIILPPAPDYDPDYNFLPEDGLFYLSKLLGLMGKKYSDFALVGKDNSSILDRILTESNKADLGGVIKYVECDNIFHEGEYIARLCCENLKTNPLNIDSNINPDIHSTNINPKPRIAIIVNNMKAKEYYHNFLLKYSIKYHDLIGTDILSISLISLFLIIAENICSDSFSLESFFNLLAHPWLVCDYAELLKKNIINQNRFAHDLATVKNIAAAIEDSGFKLWFSKLHSSLSNNIIGNRFPDILIQIINIAEKICPDLWRRESDFALTKSITEIIKNTPYLKVKNLSDFPALLKQVIHGGRLYKAKNNIPDPVVMCRLEDIALINFDLLILTDFNETVFPSLSPGSPWLNKAMLQTLNMHDSTARFGSALYDFYLNLHSKKVIITRAKKQSSDKNLLASPFLLRLEHILAAKLEKHFVKMGGIDNISALFPSAMASTAGYATSDIFPSQLSATDIELLIRSPYNFYAKKILKLKEENSLTDKPGLADFGNFFHLAIDRYTKDYSKLTGDKLSCLINISDDILTNSIYPPAVTRIWQEKFTAIARDFIEFDEQRRQDAVCILSEVRGEINLNINNHPLRISAIADRIEIDRNQKATILDYKTGTVPDEKDVLSGISPQLIIEYIIMQAGGFGHYPALQNIRNSGNIIYVKIGSSRPYITIKEIAVSSKELLNHKAGLIALIEHYIAKKQFPYEVNIAKYDSYAHLARRIEGKD